MVRELGIGGTERQLVETARFLSRERFMPHVGCFRPDGPRRAELESAGIPILHLPLYSPGSKAFFPAATQFVRYLREQKIQVVHSFDAPLNIFAVPIAKLAGTPAVISSQRGHRDLTGARNKQLLRITDRLTDAIVVNCNAMRRHLVDKEGVSESKIHLCYSAVDFQSYRRIESTSRWPGHTVVGVVCALRPEKRLGTLIRAFAKLGGEKAKLVIVGSGPKEPGLKALVGELGVGENCYFEPANSDVAGWLNQIDIFVLQARVMRFASASLDADLYWCTLCVLRWLTPLRGTGSLLLFDEFLGEHGAEKRAFDEWSRETGVQTVRIGEFMRVPAAWGKLIDSRPVFQVVGTQPIPAPRPPLKYRPLTSRPANLARRVRNRLRGQS